VGQKGEGGKKTDLTERQGWATLVRKRKEVFLTREKKRHLRVGRDRLEVDGRGHPHERNKNKERNPDLKSK